MRKLLIVGLLGLLAACQTVEIKEKEYKTAAALTELGSVGEAYSLFKLENDFKTRAFPKLENKIRVAVEIIPFTKKLSKAYTAKGVYNQSQGKMVYNDSLPLKPEIVTVNITDVAGLANELNADYNSDMNRSIQDTKDNRIVSGIAIVLSNEDIAKIKQADTYYLSNNQERKYLLQLYKQGKKSDVIDLTTSTVLGYRLSKFCWNVTERGKWYIADLVEDCSSCRGNTKSYVSEKKKEKNLFDM